MKREDGKGYQERVTKGERVPSKQGRRLVQVQ